MLGVLPDSNYESDKIDLRHGDVLVLYTDGAVEAENSSRRTILGDTAGKDCEYILATER